MTTERLQEILDAYGADPARWPDAEREAARALLARSPGLAADAHALDALLDRALAEAPGPALAARVLAQAPAARRARVRRLPVVAAVTSLAAAAGVMLWLTNVPAPGPEPEPRAVVAIPVDDLGVYATATDVLLDDLYDVVDDVPSLGCSAGGLGCPDLDHVDTPDATSRAEGSLLA